MTRLLLPALALLVLSAAAVQAQSRENLRRVVLVNGDVYVGTVDDETADPVVVRSGDGVERRFSRTQIAEITPLIRGRFFRTDPVKTRFTIAPTARTLGGGEIRADLYPSVTVGLSDRVDGLATGFFVIGSDALISPLVGIKAQVYASETAQVALGTSAVFLIGGGDGGVLAVPYGVVTLGDETRAVTFGAGGFFGSSTDGDFEVANSVVLGVGGDIQINNGVKLFVEALTLVGSEDSGLLLLPGVRLFGSKFAFDIIGYLATDFDTVTGFAPIPARLSYRF